MTTKSKSTLTQTPKKSTSTAPRGNKASKGVAKGDADKSSKIASKPSAEKQSPKLSSPPDKKPTQVLKPSELQAELNVAQEDLKKAKEKLTLVEREKEQALQEVKEAQKLAEEANKKLREAQKHAEETSEIEKFRAAETGQAEEKWQKELEAMRNQHNSDVSALLSATEELQRVKQELARQKGDLEESECRAKEEASDMAKKVESLMSELETVKEEKNQAMENEKLAEDSVQTLLEEKNKLRNDLEAFKEEEDKNKKVIESLTSAMHEVSSEAREAKESLLASQAVLKHCETQLEDLKLALQATNEKYENILDEAKEKIDALTNSVEQYKDEHQKLQAKWEEKNSSMEEEEMRLKERLMDNENNVQSVLLENEELRTREAASLRKTEELSKLLEEALAKKEGEENGELSDTEKDYDMLPKVVEFSEQNGGGGTPEVSITLLDEAVHTSTEDESSNGKLNENENKENEDDSLANKGEFKMWESCQIGVEDLPQEKEAEQEVEPESKVADVGATDDHQINVENGSASPTRQQSQIKKKKALLYKFGSLLKMKSSSSQK